MTPERFSWQVNPSGSDITLDQFSRELQKRNIDVNFPREKQRLLFESITNDVDAPVSIASILEQVPPPDLKRARSPVRTSASTFAAEVKLKIGTNLIKQREACKLPITTGEVQSCDDYVRLCEY